MLHCTMQALPVVHVSPSAAWRHAAPWSAVLHAAGHSQCCQLRQWCCYYGLNDDDHDDGVGDDPRASCLAGVGWGWVGNCCGPTDA
jgi:hypothetical protein